MPGVIGPSIIESMDARTLLKSVRRYERLVTDMSTTNCNNLEAVVNRNDCRHERTLLEVVRTMGYKTTYNDYDLFVCPPYGIDTEQYVNDILVKYGLIPTGISTTYIGDDYLIIRSIEIT